MTMRRLLLLIPFLALPGWGAISEITAAECAAAATSCTPGTTVVGDLLILGVYNSAAATAPTAPAGAAWNPVKLASNAANTNALVVACKVAASTSETTGTWTNATEVALMVFRGTLGGQTPSCDGVIMGGGAVGGGASTVLSYTGITMRNGDGSSWIVAFGAHRTATNTNTAPTGLTLQQTAGTGPMLAAFSSAGGKASWSTQTVTVNANSGWRTWVGEIIAPCAAANICSDVYMNMNTADANGTALTTTILGNGSQIAANFTNWTIVNGTTLIDTIQAHVAAMTRLEPIINRADQTYATNSTSRSINYVHNHPTNFGNWLKLNGVPPSGAAGASSAAGWVTVGPSNDGVSGGFYSYLIVDAGTGDFVNIQLDNGSNSAGCGSGVYAVEIESSPGATNHSSCITLTPGSTYWMSEYVDWERDHASLYVFDTTGTQVGHVVNDNIVTHAASTTMTSTINTNTITVASATGIVVGQLIVGAGIPPGDMVTNISGTTITMRDNATASGGPGVSVGFVTTSLAGGRQMLAFEMMADEGINDANTSTIENWSFSYTQPQDPMGPGTLSGACTITLLGVGKC